MLKRLLLLSCAALLSLHGQAQSVPAVKLPGEGLPGAASSAPALVARRGTVSQLQELLIQNWTGSTWADFSRQVYLRYSAPTLPGTIRTDRKNGASWVLYGAHRYRYTSAGEILTDSTDQYQQLPYGAYFASINTFNTPSQVRWEWYKSQIPGSGSAQWDSLKRNSHTYNAAGQRTQVLEELYSSGSFSQIARRLWSYNSLGQISVAEAQSSSGSGTAGSWDPLQRFTYTYNAAGRVQQAISEAVLLGSNTYGNSARNTYSFDAQGREVLLTTEVWTNNAWMPSSQTAYAYAANGELTMATLQAWNSNIGAYQNYQRIVLAYSQVTGTRNSHGAAHLLSVAPNPGTGDDAVVHYQLAAPATTAVEVFDLAGRRVALVQPTTAQAVGAHSVPLAGLSLVPGLYTVRLQAGGQQTYVKWDKR